MQQVQIDVVVASVDRNMIRNRGFDFFIGGTQANFASIVSGLLGAQTLAPVGTTPVSTAAANLQLGIVPAPFFAALQALRTEGIAKFLAEPRVVTQTGRPAFFRAGGQQAILSADLRHHRPRRATGAVRHRTGSAADRVRQRPDLAGNQPADHRGEPGPRASRSAARTAPASREQTGAHRGDAGVRSDVRDRRADPEQRPGVVDARCRCSATCRSSGSGSAACSHEQRESELVILVTPRLVDPMDCDQVPKRLPGRETRNPDDYELFLENILEAPRGQRKVWNGRCYNAACKCDPTAAIFPCVGERLHRAPERRRGCAASGVAGAPPR